MLIAIETHYSRWGRSTLSPKMLPGLARKNGHRFVGIADRGSLGGTYNFSLAIREANAEIGKRNAETGDDEAPLIPVIGERLQYGNSVHNGWITVHALNEQGWANLVRLNNRYHVRRREGFLTIEDVLACNAGIFVTTGGLDGPLDRLIQQDHLTLARAMLSDLNFALGGRLAVAFERHDAMDEADLQRERCLAELAAEEGVPGLGLTPVRHLSANDQIALDVLVYNAEKKGIPIEQPGFRGPPAGSHVRSADEIRALFRDTPALVENLERLGNAVRYSVPDQKPKLPTAKWIPDEKAAIIADAQAGLERHIAKLEPGTDPAIYRTRLETELRHITGLNFSGYFLIVADFIRWCREHDIPVGPGRGSGAGSLVAWSLGITDIDPIRWGLLFERFINPDRVSLPDFDIDFCSERIEQVLDYVRERYGEDHVAKIATYGRLKGKGAFKAAARALGIGPGAAESVTKRFPDKVEGKMKETTAARALPEVRDLLEANDELRRAMDIAEILEGVVDQVGQHAAGVIIADQNLYDCTPLMYEDEAGRVSHYDMKSVEPTGLVKFDFLKLSTLTVIQSAWDRIRSRHGSAVKLDLSNLSYHDPAVYGMLNQGRTLRLFQIEQPGMTKALLQIQPSEFEDLIALVSLYRPGPMDQIPLYADRKAGRASIEYPHPALEPVLKETYGIIIYQEQVMKVAQLLSGYSLGEADLLRRAMGKKIKAEMDAQRDRFERGCVENGIAKAKATEIFDLLAKFADYGFNKSHAAAYAQVCWITACLKHHYPLEFACSNLDLDSENTDSVEQMIRECERMGIRILPPDINLSRAEFEIEGEAIRYGFKALSGISKATADAVCAARAKGRFGSASDAIVRLFEANLNKKQIETLICAGAFDSLLDEATAEVRQDLVVALDRMSAPKRNDTGPGLFDAIAVVNETQIDVDRRSRAAAQKKARSRGEGQRPRDGAFSLAAEIQREIEVIGFRLNRHPAIEHELLAFRINATPIAGLRKAEIDANVIVLGLVESVFPVQQRRPAEVGPEGVEMIVSDQTGRTRIFGLKPDGMPEEGALVVMRIETKRTGKIMTTWELPTAADAKAPAAVIVSIDTAHDGPVDDLVNGIKTAIRDHGRGGEHRLILYFKSGGDKAAEIRTLISKVNPTEALGRTIRALPGVLDVQVKQPDALATPLAPAAFTEKPEHATLF